MKTMNGAVMAALVVSLQAQVPDQIREATISGSRGTSGKCTIEVRVDIAAEVDVYGKFGRLRTIAGQPATWTRMECTDPLPYNMTDFRFRGIDGRGQVKLAQDPRTNNSMAVIRIDDPRSGSEGYTFAIEWSGASGGAPTGGFQTAAPAAGAASTGGIRKVIGRRTSRAISTEQAIDLCRTEVRTRAERDYGLRNIDITAAGADTAAGRDNWITGTFTDRPGYFRRTAGYRYNCAVDYSTGQVSTVEFLRPDGAVMQPASSTKGILSQTGYDQTQVFRSCQDAVVARTARDGYQNVNFTSIAVDTTRSGWVSGVITAARGPVNDTFDFGCSMDFATAAVRNLQLNRR
ncbi:MAG: hypothetical protein ACE15B_05980 [Bryobacteraceae bacterium]